MAAAPPPWRVFDAPPAPETAASSSPPARPFARIALLGATAAIALVAVVIGVTGSPAGTVVGPESAMPFASSDAGLLVVDVAGAVARPGVYRLPAGSRVGDAIAAAGGFAPGVSVDAVAAALNLAEPVHDGQQVLVPGRAATASGAPAGSNAPAAGKVDLNRATSAELDALPGIGPATAVKIIASRAESPFRSIEDLRTRGLVGQAAFEKLRDLVTVG